MNSTWMYRAIKTIQLSQDITMINLNTQELTSSRLLLKYQKCFTAGFQLCGERFRKSCYAMDDMVLLW